MPSSGIEGRLNGHDMEQVRVEFTHLYRDENKKLSEIIGIFEARGINATKQQWKTQITRWNIRKNKKESDMVFAANKANTRKRLHGKETTFVINGQTKNLEDVHHYFKRRRKTADEFSVEANTPEAIQYFTPRPVSPALGVSAATSPIDLESNTNHVTQCEVFHQVSDAILEDSHDNFVIPTILTRRGTIGQALSSPQHNPLKSTSGITLSRQPSTPRDLYTFELGLTAIGAMYSQDIAIFPQRDNMLRSEMISLSNDMFTSISHQNVGNYSTAQSVLSRATSRLPHVLQNGEKLLQTLLPLLMQPLSRFVHYKQHEHSKLLLHSVYPILHHTLTKTHPFFEVVKSLQTSFEHSYIKMERYALQAIELLNKDLPRNFETWYDFGACLLDNLCAQRNFHGLVAYSKTMLETINLYYPQANYVASMKTQCLSYCVNAYMDLGDFPNAIKVLNEMSKFLQSWKNVGPYAKFDVYFLWGKLRLRQGDPRAIEDLTKAWELSMSYFGVEHGTTLNCYCQLQYAISRSSS